MLVSLHRTTEDGVPFRLIVLVPCVAPKAFPEIVTRRPTAPVVGVRLLMLSPGSTVKPSPSLAMLFTLTTTFPVVASVGTGTTIAVVLQLLGVPVVPLNFTVLMPCVEPKFVPVIVTDVPTVPD